MTWAIRSIHTGATRGRFLWDAVTHHNYIAFLIYAANHDRVGPSASRGVVIGGSR